MENWILQLPRMHLIPILFLSKYEIFRGSDQRYCCVKGKPD